MVNDEIEDVTPFEISSSEWNRQMTQRTDDDNVTACQYPEEASESDSTNTNQNSSISDKGKIYNASEEDNDGYAMPQFDEKLIGFLAALKTRGVSIDTLTAQPKALVMKFRD